MGNEKDMMKNSLRLGTQRIRGKHSDVAFHLHVDAMLRQEGEEIALHFGVIRHAGEGDVDQIPIGDGGTGQSVFGCLA